jgi:preprotein translocase subunit SecE
MARLKRKKPITAKKKQKDERRPDSRQLVPGKDRRSAQADGEGRTVTAKSEAPRLVKPLGRATKPAFIAKSIQFLREVKVELKKVTWPSRKETAASTLVVIILVMIISIFLGIVDMGLSNLIRFVLG